MSLYDITYKDTIIFKLPITNGKVIKVYDGDTITIATKLPYATGMSNQERPHELWRRFFGYMNPFRTLCAPRSQENSPFYRFSVRLRGIDCPELRTKNENEKHCAILAKDMIHNHIYQKIVTLENVAYDKYGRVLADVFLDGTNITDVLIDKRLAVVYDGGTKHCPDDWLAYYQG